MKRVAIFCGDPEKLAPIRDRLVGLGVPCDCVSIHEWFLWLGGNVHPPAVILDEVDVKLSREKDVIDMEEWLAGRRDQKGKEEQKCLYLLRDADHHLDRSGENIHRYSEPLTDEQLSRLVSV